MHIFKHRSITSMHTHTHRDTLTHSVFPPTTKCQPLDEGQALFSELAKLVSLCLYHALHPALGPSSDVGSLVRHPPPPGNWLLMPSSTVAWHLVHTPFIILLTQPISERLKKQCKLWFLLWHRNGAQGGWERLLVTWHPAELCDIFVVINLLWTFCLLVELTVYSSVSSTRLERLWRLYSGPRSLSRCACWRHGYRTACSAQHTPLLPRLLRKMQRSSQWGSMRFLHHQEMESSGFRERD